MDIDDRTCVDVSGDIRTFRMTPAEVNIVIRMMNGTGYSLQVGPHRPGDLNGRGLFSKLGAQNCGSGIERREKRPVQHNQLFKEEPWTASTVTLVEKLKQKCSGMIVQNKNRKFGETSTLNLTQPLFLAELEAVKKKLVRGDYIGMTQFEKDVEAIWKRVREREPEGSKLYMASIQLEIAYNQAVSEQQDFEIQVKRTALCKSKPTIRRKKLVLRKCSDNLDSKQTADCDQPTACDNFEASLAKAELEEKLPRLSDKDFGGVRNIVTHHGGVDPSRDIANSRKLPYHKISDPALKELLAFTRQKVNRKAVQKRPKKARAARQRKPSFTMEDACDMTSNSSFLTGSRQTYSGSDSD